MSRISVFVNSLRLKSKFQLDTIEFRSTRVGSFHLVYFLQLLKTLKGIYLVAAINRLEKRPQILCFFSYTMKPDASKLSSTIDYIFDLAPGPAFNYVDSF